MAASSPQKRYSLYNNIEDFTFSMPGGWDDYTISVFLEGCQKFIGDLQNYGGDFMRQWSRIVEYGLAMTNNLNCFNITVTMELAKVLKAYLLKNSKFDEYTGNSTFKILLDDTKDLLAYFPNANESQIPALHTKKSYTPPSDKCKPIPVEEVIKNVSKQYAHLFGAKGIPTRILWSEMSQKVTEKTRGKVDVKQFLENLKIEIATKVRKEKDVDAKVNKFLELTKDYIYLFDYIPPRNIKASEFLPPDILNLHLESAIDNTYKRSDPYEKANQQADLTNISDDFEIEDFMNVEDVGAYCEIPYCEEMKSNNSFLKENDVFDVNSLINVSNTNEGDLDDRVLCLPNSEFKENETKENDVSVSYNKDPMSQEEPYSFLSETYVSNDNIFEEEPGTAPIAQSSKEFEKTLEEIMKIKDNVKMLEPAELNIHKELNTPTEAALNSNDPMVLMLETVDDTLFEGNIILDQQGHQDCCDSQYARFDCPKLAGIDSFENKNPEKDDCDEIFNSVSIETVSRSATPLNEENHGTANTDFCQWNSDQTNTLMPQKDIMLTESFKHSLLLPVAENICADQENYERTNKSQEFQESTSLDLSSFVNEFPINAEIDISLESEVQISPTCVVINDEGNTHFDDLNNTPGEEEHNQSLLDCVTEEVSNNHSKPSLSNIVNCSTKINLPDSSFEDALLNNFAQTSEFLNTSERKKSEMGGFSEILNDVSTLGTSANEFVNLKLDDSTKSFTKENPQHTNKSCSRKRSSSVDFSSDKKKKCITGKMLYEDTSEFWEGYVEPDKLHINVNKLISLRSAFTINDTTVQVCYRNTEPVPSKSVSEKVANSSKYGTNFNNSENNVSKQNEEVHYDNDEPMLEDLRVKISSLSLRESEHLSASQIEDEKFLPTSDSLDNNANKSIPEHNTRKLNVGSKIIIACNSLPKKKPIQKSFSADFQENIKKCGNGALLEDTKRVKIFSPIKKKDRLVYLQNCARNKEKMLYRSNELRIKRRKMYLARRKLANRLRNRNSINNSIEDILNCNPNVSDTASNLDEISSLNYLSQNTFSNLETYVNEPSLQNIRNEEPEEVKKGTRNHELLSIMKKKEQMFSLRPESSDDDSDTPFTGFGDCTSKYFRSRSSVKVLNLNSSDNEGFFIVKGEIVFLKKASVTLRDFVQDVARSLDPDLNKHKCLCNCLELVKNNMSSTIPLITLNEESQTLNNLPEAYSSLRDCDLNREFLEQRNNNLQCSEEISKQNPGTLIPDVSECDFIKYSKSGTTFTREEHSSFNRSEQKLAPDAFQELQNYKKTELSASKALREVLNREQEFVFSLCTENDPVSEHNFLSQMNSYTWYNKFIIEYRNHQNWKEQLKWKMEKELQEVEKNKFNLMNKLFQELMPKTRDDEN